MTAKVGSLGKKTPLAIELNFDAYSKQIKKVKNTYWGINIPIVFIPVRRPWPWPKNPVCLSCPDGPLEQSDIDRFEAKYTISILPSIHLGWKKKNISTLIYLGGGGQFDKGNTIDVVPIGDLHIQDQFSPAITYGASFQFIVQRKLPINIGLRGVTNFYRKNIITGSNNYIASYSGGRKTIFLPFIGTRINLTKNK